MPGVLPSRCAQAQCLQLGFGFGSGLGLGFRFGLGFGIGHGRSGASESPKRDGGIQGRRWSLVRPSPREGAWGPKGVRFFGRGHCSPGSMPCTKAMRGARAAAPATEERFSGSEKRFLPRDGLGAGSRAGRMKGDRVGKSTSTPRRRSLSHRNSGLPESIPTPRPRPPRPLPWDRHQGREA